MAEMETKWKNDIQHYVVTSYVKARPKAKKQKSNELNKVEADTSHVKARPKGKSQKPYG